jgi:hypothetical protein
MERVSVSNVLLNKAMQEGDNEFLYHCCVVSACIELDRCQWGTGYLSLATHWIPRQWWPDKPVLATGWFGHRCVGRRILACNQTRPVRHVSVLEGRHSLHHQVGRRLRQHLPADVPVLIGFWPDGEEILDDERLRVAVGADYYTSSLRDAVDACLEVAHKASIDEQFQCSPASIVDTVEG